MTDFSSTIFNGLPVSVEVEWEEAEPDVGIMTGRYVVSEIFTTRHRKRDNRTIYRKIPDGWWDRIDANGDLERLTYEANH